MQFNPPKNSIERPRKKALVLDMDETLIHTSDIVFSSTLEFIPVRIYGEVLYAFKRPGVDRFLKEVEKLFEVYIFTAGDKEYAKQVLDKLCPFVPETRRLYRDACQVRSDKCFKDLNLINRAMADIILVDDNPDAVEFNPRNTIQVTSWDGNSGDTTLIKSVLPVLLRCPGCKDVRVIIKAAGSILNSGQPVSKRLH